MKDKSNPKFLSKHLESKVFKYNYLCPRFKNQGLNLEWFNSIKAF